jgi:hypothetical protein
MPVETRFCKQCERDFARKTIKISGKPVLACVPPPCKWIKTEIEVNGYLYALPRPAGWDEVKLREWYDFGDSVAHNKLNNLSSLTRCPDCGCWRHGSRGLNLKCDNCGRAWRKEYSLQRGRPPVSEEERSRIGSGTYRRRSKDIRWKR